VSSRIMTIVSARQGRGYDLPLCNKITALLRWQKMQAQSGIS